MAIELENPDHLYIIIDVNLDSWVLTGHTLGDNINAISTLVAAHILENNDNEVSIILAGPDTNRMIYTSCRPDQLIKSRLPTTSLSAPEILQLIITTIEQRANEMAGKELPPTSHIAAALMQVVAFAAKMKDARPALQPRCLIVSAKEPTDIESRPIINAEFVCASLDISVSVCFNNSGKVRQCPQLQHLATFTKGVVHQPDPDVSLAGQYLVQFGQSSWTRQYMAIVSKENAQTNAKCARPDCPKCRNIPNNVEMNNDVCYVCSVCLSVFCSRSDKCEICGSTFDKK